MKRYTFNKEELNDLIEKLYPVEPGLYPRLDIKSFTKENLDRIISSIKRIIENPIIEDIEEDKKEEKITCFSEETNKKMEEIFHNPDLLFYGHGGNAKAIMDDKFKCHYPNLGSHFVPLEGTDESLEKLKHWPHKESRYIAIMALNKHEFNPLYKERDRESSYDTDVYSIENEYFVGYYDAENDSFIPNPNFKTRHDFDPSTQLYPEEMVPNRGLQVSGEKEAIDIYSEIEKISIILFCSSRFQLDEIGYKKFEQQILFRINKLMELQEKITPEILNKQEEKKEVVNDEGVESFDWDDDWIFPSPKSINK